MIHHQDFRPGDKVDVERANRLANEIVAAAQNDCDSVERKSWYEIAVVDKNRRSIPLVRRLGPLRPKQVYLVDSNGDARLAEEDGEEDVLSGKSLSFKYVQENYEQIKWEKQRNDRVLGDVINLLGTLVQEQRTWNAQMQESQMNFFGRLQDAEDRRLDRDIRRQKEELKAAILRDIFRTARNLIPGLISKDKGGDEDEGGPSRQPVQQGRRAPKDYGPSPERALTDNILADCEEAKIDVTLFGDWEQKEGKMVPNPDKPGIFSPAQLAILVGVKAGMLPPSALDVLDPESGDERAVTMQQLASAMSVMPQGILVAFHELINMRRQARGADEPKTER